MDIDTVGQEIAANEIFGSVEAVKTVSDLYLPVAGTVLEVNDNLNGNPELVNNDPYGDGWMVKVKVTNVADVDSLLTSAAYADLVG